MSIFVVKFNFSPILGLLLKSDTLTLGHLLKGVTVVVQMLGQPSKKYFIMSRRVTTHFFIDTMYLYQA